MTQVRLEPGESIERALKRFKRKCKSAGVFADMRKHEYYKKPSVKKKEKTKAARKRARQQKAMDREQEMLRRFRMDDKG